MLQLTFCHRWVSYPKRTFLFNLYSLLHRGEELKSRAARVAKKNIFPAAALLMKRIVELKGERRQWKGGVEPRQREERRGHTHPIRAQQTPVHPEPGGTEPKASHSVSRTEYAGPGASDRRTQPGETCQRGTTSTHDHRAAGKGKTSLLWFSLFQARSPHTLSLILLDAHTDTLPHYLACEWGYFSPSRAETSVLFLHCCNVAPAAVLKGHGRQTAWRVIQRLARQAKWDILTMEDTLTCTPTTFSQVFGRQGQLMQASKYLRSVTLGPKNMCFARLCQFAGLGVVNIKSRLSACLWSVKALLVHCKSWSRLGTQHAERKPAFLPRCFQPANELHTVKKCVCGSVCVIMLMDVVILISQLWELGLKEEHESYLEQLTPIFQGKVNLSSAILKRRINSLTVS